MSDNLHTIFSGSECPPHSVLKDYFLRKLTEEEMYRVEQHLVDCEMCTDELEGLSKMKDPRDLDLIVEEINEQTFAPKVRFLGLRRNYALMTAAALLVFVFGTIVIVRLITRTQPEKMMSVIVEPGPAVDDAKVLAPPPAESAPLSEQKAVRQGKASETPVKNSSTVAVADEEMEVIGGLEENRVAEAQLPEPAPVKVGLISKRSLADSATVQPQTVSLGQGVARTAEQKERAADISGIMLAEQPTAPNMMDVAMKEYDAGDWEQAADHFEQVLSLDPENMKAAYHLASCYYKQNRFKKAERVLEPVLLDTAGVFHKQAVELSKQLETEKNR